MSQKIDKVSIGVSLALLATLVICTIFVPDATTSGLVAAKNAVVKWLGFYFILMIIFMLGYNSWLALSKYGSIRLGKEKPQYNTFGWIAMVFCAAMGTSILYWSAIEWMYYVQWPPFGMEAMSVEIEELSMAYSFFHWGIPAWSVYATGVIPIAYRYFVRKKEGLGLQDACEGVLGEKAYGPIGRIITIVFVFGILGGLTISYGTGVPMLANNCSKSGRNTGNLPCLRRYRHCDHRRIFLERFIRDQKRDPDAFQNHDHYGFGINWTFLTPWQWPLPSRKYGPGHRLNVPTFSGNALLS